MMKRTIWVTSDTHFNHQNVLKYCNRPFADVASMNEGLITMWNAQVAPDDIVIFLGDFALGATSLVPSIIQSLNGNIFMVQGNHDRSHHPTWWIQRGMVRCERHPTYFHGSDGKTYLFCHEPPAQHSAEEVYYGHTHDAPTVYSGQPHYHCACLDATHFTLLKLMDTTEELDEVYARFECATDYVGLSQCC